MHDGYHHQPLGLGELVLGSLKLFLRHLPVFMLIALVPTVTLNVIGVALLPDNLDPRPLGAGGRGYAALEIRLVLVQLLSVVVTMLMMGALGLAAHRARQGQSVLIGPLVGKTLAAAPALLLLGTVYLAIVGLGLAALLLPGLYLMARYSVLPMTILADSAGFGGLRRSASLTSGYRWPILGAMLIMLTISTLFVLAVFMAPVLVLGNTIESAPGEPDFAILMLVQSLGTAAQYALIAVFIAQLHMRLREIKEGGGVGDIAAIFE